MRPRGARLQAVPALRTALQARFAAHRRAHTRFYDAALEGNKVRKSASLRTGRVLINRGKTAPSKNFQKFYLTKSNRTLVNRSGVTHNQPTIINLEETPCARQL